MAKLTMVQALNLAIRQEMERDDSVVLLGEDVGVDGGVFRVTEGLLDRFGKERVIDTPLAEAAIAGVSIGMAIYGLKPVCEIQFSGFSYLAMDQLESHAARLRWRSRGRYQGSPWWCACPTAAACGRWSTTPRARRCSSPTLRASRWSSPPPRAMRAPFWPAPCGTPTRWSSSSRSASTAPSGRRCPRRRWWRSTAPKGMRWKRAIRSSRWRPTRRPPSCARPTAAPSSASTSSRATRWRWATS